MPKENNNRVYPDANHQPRHLAKFRKDEALTRQAEYDKLSLQEKIARLPVPGATKQRTRLEALVAKQMVAKQATEAKAAVEQQKKQAKKDNK